MSTGGPVAGAEALSTLLPYLSHEDDRVRANTVEGLEAIPGDEKFPHIMPLLEDPSPRVRANALKAIKALGGERFTSMLKGMIRHPEFEHRRSALYVLKAMNNDFSRDCLAVMLEDDQLELRFQAMEVLARRPDPATVAVLVKVLRGEGGELRRGEERVFQVIAVAGEGDGLLRPPGEVARDPDRHPAPPPVPFRGRQLTLRRPVVEGRGAC